MMTLSQSLWVVMAVMLIMANLQLITLVILHLYILFIVASIRSMMYPTLGADGLRVPCAPGA